MATTQKKNAKTNARKATVSSKPAEIRMSVVRFEDVLDGETQHTCRKTGFEMALVGSPTNVSLKGDIIYVKAPGATIRFTLVSLKEDKEHYYPIGITFFRTDKREVSEKQRLGLLNFPQSNIRLEGRTLSITDTYKDGRYPVRYKFSVVIQRGSDGKIGIIDPAISHDSSDEN